ncbi:Phospholipase/carboxylesterase [Laetiporus sulphureus 93-53]|uniref:Acyl-protein thioesterase 1 n=1 Tax=Laetiporus sulphureus 93-53 TaxID=1314785 RepID=A0A165E9A8_9APHY|nr:Phospholipase/carboxylesterase [Laetiporus sulphureus 93-53]KZT06516.1 Phospholipase/carboxylesterase [Laetiporus sulphureus 93-53]
MATVQPLKFLTVNPRTKHTATVIFIHGLGDSGHGWKPVADLFRTDSMLGHIKWVLPHAPTMKVTANMGMEMPSWFDVLNFEWRAQEDEAGMLRSVASINQLISAEVDAGITANRIVLGGFSQGGAMSILTALTSERTLGAIAVLSGWLPLTRKIKAMATPNNINTPIFWGHGEDDPLVEFDMGTRSVEFLKTELKIKTAEPDEPQKGGITFRSYEDLPHSTSNEELHDLKEWLKKVMPDA